MVYDDLSWHLLVSTSRPGARVKGRQPVLGQSTIGIHHMRLTKRDATRPRQIAGHLVLMEQEKEEKGKDQEKEEYYLGFEAYLRHSLRKQQGKSVSGNPI